MLSHTGRPDDEADSQAAQRRISTHTLFDSDSDSELDRLDDDLHNSGDGDASPEPGTEREAGAVQTGARNSIPRDVLNRHKEKRLRFEGVLEAQPSADFDGRFRRQQAVHDAAQHLRLDPMAAARVTGSSAGNGRISSFGGYDFIKLIDRGSFGIVSLVCWRGDPARTYARKQLPLAKVSASDIKKEVDLIRRACHRHVVSVVDDFVEEEWYHIILDPAADCDLEKYLRRAKCQPRTPLEWEAFGETRSRLLQWMYCLAVALRHIHSLGIRHRDIKPENILVQGDKIFLTDFGTSFHSERDTRYTHTFTRGTAKYLPQEAAGNHRFGRSGDIFSLGCVFFEMLEASSGPILSQHFPVIAETYSHSVSDPDFQTKFSQIREHPVLNRRLPERWRFAEGFLISILQLISNMLDAVPTKRYTADQVVSALGEILWYTGTPTLPCCISLEFARQGGKTVATNPGFSPRASPEADASRSASPSVSQPGPHRPFGLELSQNTSIASLAPPEEHASSTSPAVSSQNGATNDNSSPATYLPSTVNGSWSSADLVTFQGPMKNRTTKRMSRVWEERFFILRGTRLSVYKDANSLDNCLEHIDIDKYAVACSSLQVMTFKQKTLAFFDSASGRPHRWSAGFSGFAFHLIPQDGGGRGLLQTLNNPISLLSSSVLASNSTGDEPINVTGKTHYFAVTSRDERIDWMRELMLAKALSSKGSVAAEAITYGNMI